MKQLKFNPFMSVEAIDADNSEFFSNPIFIKQIDNSRPVKATITTTGTYAGTSIAAKFVDSDTEGGSYDDVTDGDFAAQTETGSATITFTLGSNVQVGTGNGNYNKWLKVSIASTGGDSGGTTDVDAVITLENVFVPDDIVEMKLPTVSPS